jgi:hypothetical protein
MARSLQNAVAAARVVNRGDSRCWAALLLLVIFANTNAFRAQPDSIYRVPAGTRITLRMDAEINSGSSNVNDTFVAYAAKAVSVRDAEVLPVGTVFEGRITAVERAKGGLQSGKLTIAIETLKLGKKPHAVSAVLVTQFEPHNSNGIRFLSILGGIGAGAVIGGAANSKTGALFGAGIGAGAGTGIVLLKKGKEMRIRCREEFEIELTKDILLPVLDY